MPQLTDLRHRVESNTSHSIEWTPPYHGERNSFQNGECSVCGAWVQVDTNPMPNGIDVAGSIYGQACKEA